MSLPLMNLFDQDYYHDTLTALHFGVNITIDAHLGVKKVSDLLC